MFVSRLNYQYKIMGLTPSDFLPRFIKGGRELSCHQRVHSICQFPQVAYLQYIVAHRRILWHIAVTVPHGWGLGIQPDGPCGAACHGGENVDARIIVIVASVADDDESRLPVERIQIFILEIVQ